MKTVPSIVIPLPNIHSMGRLFRKAKGLLIASILVCIKLSYQSLCVAHQPNHMRSEVFTMVKIDIVEHNAVSNISSDLTFQHFLTAQKDRSMSLIQWCNAFLEKATASQDIPRLLLNPKTHYYFKKMPVIGLYNKPVESTPHLPCTRFLTLSTIYAYIFQTISFTYVSVYKNLYVFLIFPASAP
jgi:hypothetical protein